MSRCLYERCFAPRVSPLWLLAALTLALNEHFPDKPATWALNLHAVVSDWDDQSELCERLQLLALGLKKLS